MKHILLFIIFLVAIGICTLFFGKPHDVYERKHPLQDKKWLLKINEEKPDVAFVGNSMLIGLEPAYFAHLTGLQNLRIMNFGTFSAYWYVLFKNMICEAKFKPKLVVFLFRDTYLTDSEFRAFGDFKRPIDTISQRYEPELDWVTYTRPISTLRCFMNNYWVPYQRHTTVRYNFERRIKNMLANWLHVDKKVPDKAIANVFDNKNLNQRLLTKQQLAIESVANSKTYDFSNELSTSFLPYIIKLASSNDIQLAFVRFKRRSNAVGIKQSERLKKYIADLKIYLEKNEIPLIDCTDLNEIKENHYADGDHLTYPGAVLFTDALAHRLPALLPNIFPKDWIVTNMIANGTFTEKLSGWYLWKKTSTLEIKTDFYDVEDDEENNNKYLSLQKEGQGGGGIQSLLSVNSGDVYKISVMVRQNNKTDAAKGTLGVYMAKSNTPRIQIRKLSNAWTRKELTYNCKNDGVATIYVHLDESSGSSSFDVTDIQCVKVNK